MATGDYTIECFDVKVEYEFHPAVGDTFDAEGHDECIELISVRAPKCGTILNRLPKPILDSIREHFLEAELSGPDPDRGRD